VPLLVLGATPGRAWVDLDHEGLVAHFGLFRLSLPMNVVAGGTSSTWPLLYGIGLRLSFDRTLGLIGSTHGVVTVHLRRPYPARLLFFEVLCKHLAISVEDPVGFLRDLDACTRPPAGAA
jgi:hypothetical protein